MTHEQELTDEQHERAAHIQKTIGDRFMDAVEGAQVAGIPPDAIPAQVLGAAAIALLMYAQKYPEWAAKVIAGGMPEGDPNDALDGSWGVLGL